MQLGNTDKWYVDQTQSDYDALAVALKAQYPQLRVGIGPAVLNDQYYGTNPPKQQIESFIAGFVPSPLHKGNPPEFVRKASNAAAPTPEAPTPEALSFAVVPQRGEKLWVLIPGFGPVEALFVAALPDGQVLIDLDGIQTSVEQSAVHRDLEAAEAAAVPPTSTPEAPAAAAPEPEAAPEPPKASTMVPEPEAAPEPSKAPEPHESAPEEPPTPQADSS